MLGKKSSSTRALLPPPLPPPSVNEKRDNFELRDTWQTSLQTRVNRIKPSCKNINSQSQRNVYLLLLLSSWSM